MWKEIHAREMENDATLLRVVEHARQLNHALDVERLERMLFIYRSWIATASGSVEGGFSLTRDELDCVLEYPPQQQHLDFLMATFHTEEHGCIDLLTLLVTCVCLARGPLEAKARFVFQLVDFDTEDEIVEDELAMLIALSSDGLRRVGIVLTQLLDVDARAIACEAFEFVSIDDGGKMTLALFVQWLVFHWRPTALFQRIESVVLLSQLIQRLHAALQSQREALVSSPFHVYNAEHFSQRAASSEHVHVLVGPIVGPVDQCSVRILIEVDHSATVRCFAFSVGSSSRSSDRSKDRVYSFEIEALTPKVLVLDGLESHQTYQFRLLGVCKRDRKRCVAIATTTRSTTETSAFKSQGQHTIWEMRAINHDGIGSNGEAYQRLVSERLTSAENRATMTSIHFSAIHLSERSLSRIMGLLENGSEECHSIAQQLVNDSFRAALNRPELLKLLQSQSNLLVSSRHDVLFHNSGLDLGHAAVVHLMRIVETPWRHYIGMLWGIHADDQIAIIHRNEFCCLVQFDATTKNNQPSQEPVITADVLDSLASVRDLTVVSETPFLPLNIAFSVSKRAENEGDQDSNSDLDEAMRAIMLFIEWRRREPSRNVCLVSRNPECGFEMQLSLKNTTISVSQVVCGPASGKEEFTSCTSREIDHALVTVSATNQVSRPHYASIVCRSLPPTSRPSSQVSSSRPVSRSTVRSSQGDHKYEAAQVKASLTRLEDERGVDISTGPIVGTVTSTSATVLLECDRAVVITICTTDRFSGQRILTRVKTVASGPVSCSIRGLVPARLYDIHTMGTTEERRGVVSTPPLQPASTRILFLGDHSFCDQTVSVRRFVSSSEGTSYLPNVLTHLAGGSSSASSARLLFDVTIRMGVVGALRHDLLDGYEITRSRGDTDIAKANHEMEKMIRSCYQAHVAVPDYRALLARGAHLFAHVGITRSLLQNGAPTRLFQAVRRVLKEYEQADASYSSGLVHSLPGPIKVVMLDSTDCLLSSDGNALVQWPESLVTASQRGALESVLGANSSSPATTSSQLLVLCDAPIVWPFTVTLPAKPSARAKRIDKVLDIAADPWVFYPHDVQALLQLLFSAMVKHPLLRITLVCCGPFASRVVISDRKRQLSIEQLTMSAVSNVERGDGRQTVARFTLERLQDELREKYEISGHVIAGSSLSSKQYCLLDVIPHSQGAVSHHKYYVAGRPESSLVLGPIIGRTTARTTRILVEVDRPVQKASCVLTALSSNHSVLAECDLEAFMPAIFKLEGLHPGTRYKIKLEGLMTSRDNGDGYVETPPLVPLSMEWLVFSRNNLRRLLPGRPDAPVDDTQSHWHRILAPGVRFFNAQPASVVAANNGDTLGQSKDLQDETFNPWYHVEACSLSEPLRQTQFSVHIGGQVDLSTTFTEEELSSLLVQLCGPTQVSDARKRDLYTLIRDRLQDIYRITWGVEPMRTILASTSNVMLLHEETDLFFSVNRLHDLLQRHHNDSISLDDLAPVALKLRAMAFELWQLYQNQLSVDVNESDLDNSRRNSSKFASHVTLGLCKLVFLNVSDELRDLTSSAATAHASANTAQVDERVLPLTLPSTATAEAKDSPVSLLSSTTWKTLEEALELVSADGSPIKTNTKAKGKRESNASGVKQLAVFVPVDLIEVVASHPSIRAEVTRLFEKLFQWKMVARTQRHVTLVCASDRISSLTFKISDEKVNETLTMTRVASISRLQEISLVSKSTAQQTKAKAKAASKSDARGLIKGHFSKRFTYQSVPISTASTPIVASASSRSKCRSYAKYLYLSDYRRGVLNENLLCFPSRALPKILLGPVIGRVVLSEHTAASPSTTPAGTSKKVTCSVPILIEVNAPARVTCVVVDSMINTEVRVTSELVPDTPHIFCIHELTPLRRYVYFFEGISNGETRRGSFHTPPASSNSLNIVAVSSNFPRDMDEEIDSLWVSLAARATLPWCGLDAILHLGGQVPLHEAAVECFHWADRELQREILNGDRATLERKRIDHVRTQVRRRFQQEYHICWNLPNIRELLAHVSHWFLRGKADMAPFLGHDSTAFVESSQAARLVLDVANRVIQSYQLNLVSAIQSRVEDHASTPQAEKKSKAEVRPGTDEAVAVLEPASDPSLASAIELSPSKDGNEGDADAQNDTTDASVQATKETEDTAGVDGSGGAQYWQHEDIAVFMCDTRNLHLHVDDEAEEPEPITCNGRLSRPLSRLENPMISEQQWKQFERALRKKRTLLFILCLELPLILTNADHVEKLRDELRPSKDRPIHWKLYDHSHIQQHWVACKRQLEQLLLLLFKWKARRSGRDVLVLSGGMRIGIDTLLRDRETQLSIRNLTVGPVTADVENFEFPLSGVACATLSGGLKDDHFTFQHSLVAKKNYLLLHARVETETPQLDNEPTAKKEKGGKKQARPSATPGANVSADFVPNESAALSRLHPIDKFRRLPLWWTQYVPMGKAVFWDDTITLKSETDERMLALREYVWQDRGFSGALELFYEKYQFAETARMEELRSRHSQHVDLQANFVSVLADLWRAIPDTKRQQMAYFLDPFVREMLLDHVSPELFQRRLQSGEPIELAFFCRVLRDFVFDACLLRLTIETQAEDELRAQQQATEQAKRDAEAAEAQRVREAQAEAQEATRMAELLRTDPLQYAQIKLAQGEAVEREKQARHDEKLARKKAERLAEMEEEQAIAKEQKKLDRLAERGDVAEYERRQKELDTRITKLKEKRAQRSAQKKAKAEKAETKAEETVGT